MRERERERERETLSITDFCKKKKEKTKGKNRKKEREKGGEKREKNKKKKEKRKNKQKKKNKFPLICLISWDLSSLTIFYPLDKIILPKGHRIIPKYFHFGNCEDIHTGKLDKQISFILELLLLIINKHWYHVTSWLVPVWTINGIMFLWRGGGMSSTPSQPDIDICTLTKFILK